MKPFGLTGNMGCGKSTVAALLSKYPDILILDCDRIAKEIILSNKHRGKINTILGVNVFLDEKANFQEIAKIIFRETEKKRLFEALIHPLVWEIVDRRVASTAENMICVVESAIIFETQNEDRFTAVIVVTCDPHEQFRRLRESRRMNVAQIQARLDHQLPSSKKQQGAHFVINTDCRLDQLEDKVRYLYHNLKQQKEVLL